MEDSISSLLPSRPSYYIFYPQRARQLSLCCKTTLIQKENNHNLCQSQVTDVIV